MKTLLVSMLITFVTSHAFALSPMAPATRIIEVFAGEAPKKPTKIELELSIEGFTDLKVKEVWWIISPSLAKLQVIGQEPLDLRWDFIFASGQVYGPLPADKRHISQTNSITEWVWHLSPANVLTEHLVATKLLHPQAMRPKFKSTSLVRWQGRVAIRLTPPVPDGNASIWFDQDSGQVSRILMPSGCDVTYLISKEHGAYTPEKKFHWGDHSGVAKTLTKVDITKHDPNFFSPEKLVTPSSFTQNSEQELFLTALRSFYSLCR